MDSRRGRLIAWVLDLHQATRRSPHTFRWWLADQLSRAAMRIRGEKVSVFGWYDGQRGNRAAIMCDRIHSSLFDISPEKADDAIDDLNELASLSGASWTRNP